MSEHRGDHVFVGEGQYSAGVEPFEIVGVRLYSQRPFVEHCGRIGCEQVPARSEDGGTLDNKVANPTTRRLNKDAIQRAQRFIIRGAHLYTLHGAGRMLNMARVEVP